MTTTLAWTFEDVLGPEPARLPGARRSGGAVRPAASGQQLGLPWSVEAARVGAGSRPGERARSSAARPAAGVAAVRSAAHASSGAAGVAGSGPRSRPPGPRRPAPRPGTAPTPRAALGLLRQATEGVVEAEGVPEPLRRYPAAYLAALRAAAAVLAVHATPQPKRGASRSVWALLADVAPELGEWAAFFASCSATRAAAEAGIARLVGQREADDLLRQAEQFVALVEEKLLSTP